MILMAYCGYVVVSQVPSVCALGVILFDFFKVCVNDVLVEYNQFEE